MQTLHTAALFVPVVGERFLSATAVEAVARTWLLTEVPWGRPLAMGLLGGLPNLIDFVK